MFLHEPQGVAHLGGAMPQEMDVTSSNLPLRPNELTLHGDN